MKRIVQIRDRHFLAAAALVSTAGHHTRLSEQIALDHLLERLEKLRIFDPHKAVDMHRTYSEAIEADIVLGRRKAIAAVSTFKGKEDDALLILYVAASIARANFKPPRAERDMLTELYVRLGLSTESFDKIWKAARRQAPVAWQPPGSATPFAHG